MFKELNQIQFPKSSNININMMPFIFGDINSLPKNIQKYQELIEQCSLEKGKVAYLTITEGLVHAGNSQRRPGIHVESPFGMSWGGSPWGGMTSSTGLYMASNDGSCEVWNELVEDRDHFGACVPTTVATKMKENTLYWLTDKTPHQALLVEKDIVRQFFRLVSNDVSIWFSRHNTANPTGVQPDCKIVDFDKFQ